MTTLATIIVQILRQAKGPDLAVTAPEIAFQLRAFKVQVDERKVREIIATELDAIAAALRPAVLLSQGNRGFWLASTDTEIQARESLLRSLAKSSRAKHRQFVVMVKAAGLGRVLERSAA